MLVPLLVVILVAYGLSQAMSGSSASRKASVAPNSVQPSAASPAVSPSAPSGHGIYRGMSAGITGEGYPYLGNPAALLTIEEYTDFLCPFCARHATQTLPGLLEKYVATGKVKYVFRDMPLVSLHPTSARGHAAARCVAEQRASAFWAMHNELFKNQDRWRTLSDPTDYLAGVAKSVGVDPSAYSQCVASGRMDTPVQQGVAVGQALGFDGTPSFRFLQREEGKSYTLVGAQPLDIFGQWIDALLAGKSPPQEQQPQAQPQELPLWANAKGLAHDPARPGFDLAGDPYRGNQEAKVVVIEFSNFQCSSCRQHALEVQPAVDKALVDTGQVMWVFKNLPLRSLRQSAVAAVAAECAGDQGRYWEMNRLLFESQSQWAVDDPDKVLVGLAEQLGLDKSRFSACLSSRQALERVMDDMYDAQGVVSTTPTFVVVIAGKGTLMRGSRPTDQFISTLQGLMRAEGTAAPAGSGR